MSIVRTVAIVGAGFSGAVTAINLMRQPHHAFVRIVLIERGCGWGRGKAYADSAHPHLLNVPACRMSIDSRQPQDFLAFAQRKLPRASGDDFLPRRLYGEYLEASLSNAQLAAGPRVRLERVSGEVCAVERLASQTLRLRLSDGTELFADQAVLALGNPPPRALPGASSLSTAAYIADPYQQDLQVRPGARVLLVGTGLTMADVATALSTAANGRGQIHAISRHGMLPLAQTAFTHSNCEGDAASLIAAARTSMRHLSRAIRELAARTEQEGGDWREAVTFVRALTPGLWGGLAPAERERFLRHLRPYWEIHRHRLPAETSDQLERLQRAHALRLHTGRILELEPVGAEVRVTWRPHSVPAARTLRVDQVINCTGPDYDMRRSQEPLVRSLVRRGLARIDSLGLGLKTGPQGALIDARGKVSTSLFYVGPLLRADHWEATAAQELRVHAEKLARHLASTLAVDAALAADTVAAARTLARLAAAREPRRIRETGM